MTRAQAKALQQWKEVYCLPFIPEKKLNLSAIFPGKEKILLEIGFGMGEATAQLASANPHWGFLGIEVHTPGIGKLLWEIENRNLQNLRIIQADAVQVLEEMIGENALHGVHIFFPDPWPKKRHHKRRLINDTFLLLVASRLVAGGYLYLVTDWEDYALSMLETLTRCSFFQNPYKDFAPPREWRPTTSFEKKALKQGHKIWEIYALKA
ncbi:MAG: tRNA (guanosine(46)-N7)-methyltransferase TrmB [Spirochaetales bacterium]